MNRLRVTHRIMITLIIMLTSFALCQAAFAESGAKSTAQKAPVQGNPFNLENPTPYLPAQPTPLPLPPAGPGMGPLTNPPMPDKPDMAPSTNFPPPLPFKVETVQAPEAPYARNLDFSNGSSHKMGVRIKDLTRLRGVCDNQLIGYGIVGGLNGSGDRKGLCENSIAYALKNLGVNSVPTSDFKPKNMAAVMVTANLPAFAKSGDIIDVTVSSIGDATDISGGVLLLTNMKAANGAVYATAQGPVSIGGLNGMTSIKADKGSKNFALVGRIAGGGLICRDMNTELTRNNVLSLVLNEPDFTTAATIARAINSKFSAGAASAVDAQTVRINSSYGSPAEAVEFMSQVNNLEVVPETSARVVINERTGTIVVGRDVMIMPVAISHGNISVTVGGKPGGPSENKIVQNARTGRVFYLSTGASVKILVEMLNYIGATPRDIIAIFQALKSASALPAELIIM
jgi:flagellar P-ring protein FlgI